MANYTFTLNDMLVYKYPLKNYSGKLTILLFKIDTDILKPNDTFQLVGGERYFYNDLDVWSSGAYLPEGSDTRVPSRVFAYEYEDDNIVFTRKGVTAENQFRAWLKDSTGKAIESSKHDISLIFEPSPYHPKPGLYSMIVTGVITNKGLVYADGDNQVISHVQTYNDDIDSYTLPIFQKSKGHAAAHWEYTASIRFPTPTNKDANETLARMISASTLYDRNDPYDGGDDPGDDDNKPGDYDHTSDPVPEPDLPTVSVTDSGLVTLFAPTEAQLKSLANYLWSDAFSLDNFKKMLNNPMDCILGLSIVPVNVPRGSAREITVGNIVTTVSCDICPTQYVKVDCGTFTFDRHDMTNSYLDYAPYSKCYLYLPFIGVQEINIDDFMQSTMHVVYHVDILTGAMFCYVMRDNSVMYTYMGQCAENVPLSSSSYSNTIGSIMSAAASIVGVASVAATGGATAPVAAGLLTGAATSTANAVTSLKPSIAHSGSIGGGAGIMGVNYPYLIFNTPHVSIPSQQRHYTGYPSNQIVKLSALKGFNVIQAINLSVSGANDAEMNEIENILKGGVIL